MGWTPELKKLTVKQYLDGNPTADNSIELVNEIAEQLTESQDEKFSSNSVRMMLMQEGVYVKKEAATSKGTADKKDGDAPKRVSKESQIAALKEAIEAKGKEVDEDILGKLTGKAAAYFADLLK